MRGAGLITHPNKRVRRHPQLFKLIEFPNFGAEDMDNDIIGVDQHPVAGILALDPGVRPVACFMRSASFSAMAPTWRALRPDAITM